jgi:MoaA/NifB/PqqE/SkfB family radical SAM enzyme
MARVILELTNRCNLRCTHCFGERHAATGDLSLAILDSILRDGRACGIEHLCFSGGEPTIHRQFETIVERTCEAGYAFSLVTNGHNFRHVAPVLLRGGRQCRGVTLSVDGAREATHDASRGRGSFRQLMRAAALSLFKGLPFTFNMVLTALNCGEVEEMVDLAARLGSRGVRFGHLMFTPENTSRGLNLSPDTRRDVEAHIWRMRDTASVPVEIAPGYFSESPFFPCAPLELDEYNVDYAGNVTLCCHLSGYSGPNAGDDILGNLNEIDLVEACRRVRARVATYLADKRDAVNRGAFGELDHFPCWYCVKYLGKVAAADGFPGRSWLPRAGASTSRRFHVLAFHAASGS